MRGVARAWLAASIVAATVEAQDVLRVGGVIQTKGKHKIIGWHALRALEAWQDWQNQQTAETGVTVQLDFRDADNDDDLEAVTDLVKQMNDNNEIDVIVAPYTSGASLMLVNKLKDSQKPIMVWGGASEAIFEQEERAPNVFGFFTPAGEYMTTGLTELMNQVNTPQTAMLIGFEGNVFGDAVCKGANKTATELGYSVMSLEIPALGPTEVEDWLKARFLNATDEEKNPDVLVGCGHKTGMVDLVRLIHEEMIALKPHAILATQVATTAFKQQFAGEEAAICGLMMPTQWSQHWTSTLSDPVTKWTAADFSALYASWTGVAPTYHSASAGAVGVALSNAIKAGGVANIGISLGLLRIDSFYGHIQFAQNGQSVGKPMLTLQNMPEWQGDTLIVAPPSAQEVDMNYRPTCPLPPFRATRRDPPSVATLAFIFGGVCIVCAVLSAIAIFVMNEEDASEGFVQAS